MIRSQTQPISHAVALLLTLAVMARAQTTMPTTSAATEPATQATTAPADTQPSTQPSTMPTTLPARTPVRPLVEYSPNNRVSFNFTEASVDAVLDFLSENLGFIVIKGTKIEGRVTIVSRQAVSPDEAVELVNTVLKPLNYTAIQSGRVLKIMSRDQAKKANIPVQFGADPEKIKATDEIITQVIPMGQVDAAKLRQDLTAMFSADADVTSNAASNTIIITDTSANIRRIVEIIHAMDRHLSSAADIKVFQLKNAVASTTAKLITELFKTDTTSSTSGPRGFVFPGFGGRGGAGGTGTDSATTRGGKVTASSDDRTNTLVVVGPAETLETIDGLVKKLDSDPIQDTSFFIYPLKNAKAQNLQSVLNGFFGNSTSGSTGSTNTNRSNNFQPLGTSSIGGFGGSSGSSSRTGTTGSRNTSTLGSTLGGNTSRNTGLASSMSGLAKANSDLVGQVYVVAEPDTNSLLITTSSKYQTRVKDMIAQLDRDVPQVLIKVLVAEVTHTDSSDIGIEYSILNKRPSGNGSAGGSDMAIASAISNAVATGTPGGLVASVVESNFTMALKALATNGKLDVLSRPSILASDNQLASILVGQSVPFITSSNITTNGNVINSVTYQDIGIILNVTPHINPDGLVIMDVAPEISQVSSQTVTIQEGVKVPVIDKRSAQSRVAIKDGQTIIIGGLMQDRVTDTVSKIPLLGDIPWLGELFKSTTKKKEKTELLIFLTPLVARQPEHLQGMTTEDLNRTKLVPNAISTETFNEHMQGMQRTSEPAATQPATTQPVPPR